MQENDADTKTIGDYLGKLLATLWRKGDSFSSKRPFGNGDWQYDVYAALINSGAIEGALDEDGCVCDVDHDAADKIVLDIIQAVFEEAE